MGAVDMFLFSIIPIPSSKTPDPSNQIGVNEDKIIKLESLFTELILETNPDLQGIQGLPVAGNQDMSALREELYRLRAEDLKLKEGQNCTVA